MQNCLRGGIRLVFFESLTGIGGDTGLMETVGGSQLTAQPAPWRGRIQSAVLSKSLSAEAARGPKITNDYIIFKNTNTQGHMASRCSCWWKPK